MEDYIDQEDPKNPPLPKGYNPIQKTPPLPKGYSPLKKKEPFDTDPNFLLRNVLNGSSQKLGPSGNIPSPTISPSQEETNNLPSTSTLGYQATDARVGGEERFENAATANKTAAGIYNTLVGSAARIVGGLGEMAQNLSTPVNTDLWTTPRQKDERAIFAEPEGEFRKNAAGFIEKARSPLSTKEDEAKAGEFDIHKKSLGENLKALAFTAPSMVADVMAGTASGGATYILQGVNDAAQEIESNPATKDMSDNSKLGYTYTMGMVNAALMKFNFDKIFKGTGVDKLIAKSVTNKVIDGFIEKGITATKEDLAAAIGKEMASFATKAQKAGLKTAVNSITGFGTGAAMAASHKGLQGLVNLGAGKEIFDTKNIGDDILNSGTSLALFSGITGIGHEMLSNHAEKVKENLTSTGLPADVHNDYIFQSLREKQATSKAEKLTDPTLIKEQKEIAKDAAERKEQLLQGKKPEEIVTEKEQKEIDDKEKNQIALQRLHEDNKLDIEKLDAEKESIAAQRKGLGGRKPEDRDAIAKLEIKSKEHEVKRKRINEDYQKAVEKLTEEVVETEKDAKNETVTPSPKQTPTVSEPLKDVEGERNMRGVKYSDIFVGSKGLEDILDDHKLSESEKQQVRGIFDRHIDYFKFDEESAKKWQESGMNPEDINDVSDLAHMVSVQKESDWGWHNEQNYMNVKDAIKYMSENKKEFPDKVNKAVEEIKQRLESASSFNRLFAIDVNKQLGIKEPSNPPSKTVSEVGDGGKTKDKTQMDDRELQGIVGRDVFKQIERAESQLGEGIVDRNRLIETAKRIQKVDKKDKLLPEHIFEALQYETGYPDNWQDLRDVIKKGGIDINSDAIERQIEVGVILPKDIVEKFKESKRYKDAIKNKPNLVKAVDELLNQGEKSERSAATEDAQGTKADKKTTQQTENQVETEVGKPPTEGEPVLEGEGGGSKKGITHEATQETTRKAGLPDYEGQPVETHAERIAKAKEDIAANPNLANETMEKAEKNAGSITPQDNAVLAVYKGALDKELEANPSKEIFDRINRLAKVLNPEGSYAGKLLESRKLIDFNEDNLANFLLEKQAAQGTALTEPQIKSESAKYEELKVAKEKLEEQLQKEREQHAKDIAELGLNKARVKAKKEAKKSHEEYKAERKAAVEAAREDLKNIRLQSGLKATIIPGSRQFKELVAIAPHVKDFLQSLANEGIDKLDVAVSQIHAEFKDILDGITTTDIFNIIGGEYDIKKEQTRNQKAANLRLIQREAALIKELARERKGEEKTKSEKQKTASNRRIDELKQKIKDVRQQRKEEAEPVEDASVGESERLHSEIDKLTKKAQSLANDIKNKKYLEEKPQPKPFARSAKYKALQDRVIDLENKIRHERSKDEYEKRSKVRKAFDKVMEVLGVRRLVQSAVDISVPFRQGATLISPRRIDVWAKGFKANLQSIFSPKRFERIMYEIRHDKDYHDAVKDGIVYNDLGSADPNLHNEDFRKSFIYDIPVISEPLKASNRSADAFLNVARYEMYKKMRRVLEMKGLTRESDPKAFKFIGNWVMSMTGRGRMTNMLENSVAHTVLGNTFYGARLMASRFNLLNPVTYFDPRVPREAKVEAMKDMAAFVVTTMAAGAGLAAAGGKVSLNPDDSDFLQVRFGDKVYDISGGLANYVRTFLRIVKAGYTKATATKYEGKQATDKAGESVLNFFRNKLSPNTGYAADAFFGGRYGQGFDPTDIAKIYPMYADDAIKAFKDEGAVSLATVLLPNILGVGYGSYASKGQIDKNLEDLLKRNMRSDEMNNEKIYNYNDGGRQITDKEFNDFADKRDAVVEKGIEKLFKEGALVLDENNEVVQKPYQELTPDQVAKETSEIKAKATTKVKEELFGKQKETYKQKEGEAKLEGAKKLKEFHEKNQEKE